MVEGSSKARLRRINNANGQNITSLPIMVLKENGVTTFGRNPANDFLLDSHFLKNFISRLHCKVECNKTSNGKLEYKIFDCSMNGTFINDYRLMPEGHVFTPGDKVNFGHLNGFNIKPGSFAKQRKSEFYFVFEFVDVNETQTPETDKEPLIWNSPSCKNGQESNSNGIDCSHPIIHDRFELVDVNEPQTPKTDKKPLIWKSPCCKSGQECSSLKKRKKKPMNMMSILSYLQPKSKLDSSLEEDKKELKEKVEENQSNDTSSGGGLVCYIFDENTRKIRRLSPSPNENDSLTVPIKNNITKDLMSDSGIAKERDESEESDITLFDRVLLSVDNFLHYNSDSDIFASDEEP